MWRAFLLLAPALALRTANSWGANFSALPPFKESELWQDNPKFPTLVEKSAPYHGSFLQEPRSRVIVLPEHKLAFCYIEKNACTQFNRLFNLMNHNAGPIPFWRSTMLNFKLDWKDVSRAKGWKWAVFLRDPLQRYLSAWGSKCVQKEEIMNCVPRGMLSPNATVADFEKQVRANVLNEEKREKNPHWARQQDFCGGLKDGRGYDFVGLLQGDVHSQVKAMLRMVNASTEKVERFFPKQGLKGHQSAMRAAKYYKSEEVQKLVMSMYADDFRLPGLDPHRFT